MGLAVNAQEFGDEDAFDAHAGVVGVFDGDIAEAGVADFGTGEGDVLEDSVAQVDIEVFCAAKSQSKNSEGFCFWAKGWMARRDEGEYPLWILD
jgi:hypothetical protein